MRTENKSYTGIDTFRLIAALLIIAIHTSPFGTYSEVGDFILTRVVARTAVPFFFMTSGFFLVSRYQYSVEKLENYVKKTALIYGAAIAIYIPVNIYTGYFKMENLLPNMIKDLVFDGTLYHLWYLPASLIGGVLAWYFVRKLGYTKAFAVVVALYLIGLFGDSYYGLTARILVCKNFYELLFQVSDYTRNGIFFAPVFFVLGGWIADCQMQSRFGGLLNLTMTVLMLLLMLTEGLLLRYFQLQRHDSMYLFLLPCVYFLFCTLLHFQGKRRVWVRDISFLVYIIHPMMILVVRLAAKVLHLQRFLVDNSAVHFLAVVLTSVMVSATAISLWGHVRHKRKKADINRAYIEINRKNLEHNVSVLCEAMPPKCELMAVVKAEAYGHGMYEIATHLDRIGVRAFAVATIDEGIALRHYGIRGEILILGYTAPARVGEIRKYDLTQTLVDYDYACRLNAQKYKIKAHLKVDTGMHRLGFDDTEQQNIRRVFSMKYLVINGIYTHLCVADSQEEADICFTRQQIARFYHVINKLKNQGIPIPKIHIQSSYGLLNYPELKCSYVRAGIALYGVLSTPNAQTKLHLDLKPVLALRARIILIRDVKEGDSIGYGRSFTVYRNGRIAIVSIGYADGFPRALSNRGQYVLINGQSAPIVGRICMDQLAVDITDNSNVCVGMIATLIGRDENSAIAAPDVAKNTESISNELLSRVGTRVTVITI